MNVLYYFRTLEGLEENKIFKEEQKCAASSLRISIELREMTVHWRVKVILCLGGNTPCRER
jgi:hypothetical protein